MPMVYGQPPSAGGPPDDGGGKFRAGRSHVFTALGGFVVGVIASVAVVAIFGVGSPASSTPSPGASGGGTAPAPSGTGVGGSPPPDVVRHQGPVTLARGNGVDLDSTAGNWGETSSSPLNDLELTPGGGSIDYPPGSTNFVRVSPSASVSYATCAAAATGYVSSFDGSGQGAGDQVSTDLRFCAVTTDHRFSFVEVTSAPYDPATVGLTNVTVEVTTWERRAP